MITFYAVPSDLTPEHDVTAAGLVRLVNEANPLDSFEVSASAAWALLDHLVDTPFASLTPSMADGEEAKPQISFTNFEALIDMVSELDAGPWRIAMPNGFSVIEQCIRAAAADEAGLLIYCAFDAQVA